MMERENQGYSIFSETSANQPWESYQKTSESFKTGPLAYESYWDGYGDNPWTSVDESFGGGYGNSAFDSVQDDSNAAVIDDDTEDYVDNRYYFPWDWQADDGYYWNNNWSTDDDYYWSNGWYGNNYYGYGGVIETPLTSEQLLYALNFLVNGGQIGDYKYVTMSQLDSVEPQIVGNDVNFFRGSQSSDVIIGRESGFDNYRVFMDLGDDVFRGGKLMENVMGGGGDDVVFTGGGKDEVSMGKGYDSVYAVGGDNVGGGDDVDTLFYGVPGGGTLGNYKGVTSDIVVDLGYAQNGYAYIDDRMNTVISFENVYAGPGDDKLYGDDLLTYGGNDLYGAGGDDELYGRYGDDKLFGGDGDDFLSGGAGRDVLNGGSGADTFFYEAEAIDATDVIVGYEWQDVIDLRELGLSGDYFVYDRGHDTVLSFKESGFEIDFEGDVQLNHDHILV